MVLRHLFQMSQIIAAAFLLSCAGHDPNQCCQPPIRGGYGSL